MLILDPRKIRPTPDLSAAARSNFSDVDVSTDTSPSDKITPDSLLTSPAAGPISRKSSINRNEEIAKELADSQLVRQCARQHNTVGDLSAMKVCYLLRHNPNLSVSEIAELVGLSVSATSRCLTKLKIADIVSSSKEAQTVRYQLQNNKFTKQLIAQLEA